MTSDLEKEARAAADDWMETLPDSSDIGNTETHVDDAYEAGYLAAAEPREKKIEELRAEKSGLMDAWVKHKAMKDAEIASLRARVAELEMVIANYLPVCVGDCGCEGALAGCAILGDDPEASAIAESVAAKIIPLPEAAAAK